MFWSESPRTALKVCHWMFSEWMMLKKMFKPLNVSCFLSTFNFIFVWCKFWRLCFWWKIWFCVICSLFGYFFWVDNGARWISLLNMDASNFLQFFLLYSEVILILMLVWGILHMFNVEGGRLIVGVACN